MSESFDKLSKLTSEMFTKQETFDVNGVKISIIQTVDEKLVEATDLIKDAQNTLALAKDVRDAASVKSKKDDLENKTNSDNKDAQIVQLTKELKTANDEITNIKDNNR